MQYRAELLRYVRRHKASQISSTIKFVDWMLVIDGKQKVTKKWHLNVIRFWFDSFWLQKIFAQSANGKRQTTDP